MARHILARSLHDVGLATWFGGSLMGAIGLNGAAASLRNPDERSAAATVGWSRWAPVSAMAVGAHLLGATQLLRTERARISRQEGLARSSAIKTGLTVAALGATAYSGVLNRKMAAAGHVPAEGATEPAAATPPDVAKTQKQLKVLQWVIPGLTGSLIGVTAWQSEQMRPRPMLGGILPSLPASGFPVAAGTAAGAALLVTARRKRPVRVYPRFRAEANHAPVTVTQPTTLPPSAAGAARVASATDVGASDALSSSPPEAIELSNDAALRASGTSDALR